MDEIEEIKQRVDIVDLVGQYVALKKAGVNHKGLCPFHHERTPSFMVNPSRQIFKCFGCNKGGDIFTFIQEIEKVEFGDALRILANRAGVVLKPRTKPRPGEAPSEKSRYFAINALATGLFHKILTDHPAGEAARQYLSERKITKATIKKWRLGYAPRKKVLTDFLIKRGFSPKEIERAGKPDMFYDRIMFPITDVMGNVVGFTGRALAKAEPKYLNSPETPIFRKSRILFGLEQAKKAVAEKHQVILAEGQMDVISAWQAGTDQIVATSGTALTSDHLRILARYDADIIFAFDADSAGETATKKAIELAIGYGLSVKVIPLPAPYKDIGELVEHDPSIWLELVKQPVPAIEWQISTVFDRYRAGALERKLSVDEKKRIAKEILPILAKIPDVIEKAHYIQQLARRLAVKEATIVEAMKRFAQAKGDSTPVSTKSRKLSTEEALLGLLELKREYRETHSLLYKSLSSWYKKAVNDLLFLVEEQYRGLSETEIKAEIALLAKRYEDKQKDQLKADFAQKISEAETKGDRASVKQLLSEFQTLLKDQRD